MKVWSLLDTGHLSAAENMALDDVLLECRAKDLIPNTLRFLQFDPPAVLIGYNQSVKQEVRTEFCEMKGIDINRRLTGGGAIFFGKKTLGWEIFASKSELGAHQPVTELFERMCTGTTLALQALGIQSSFRPKNDIEIAGRKISGTGGTERDDAFLFQGTLLIDFDVDMMVHALRIPIMKLKDKEIKSVKERVTCIRWELERQPSLITIKHALTKGFEEAFQIKLIERQLTIAENHLLKERLKTFQSDDWIFLDRRPSDEAAKVSAIEKTPGGLIRVTLTLDRIGHVIKSALITGDFFVFPSRAILDLEAKLKYASYQKDEIYTLIHAFFKTSKTQILGVTPDDLIKLILKAIAKVQYEKYGINIEEANHIYTNNGGLTDILNGGCEALLLPYCAKLPTCEYRKKDGCIKCGECSIGEAYELAEKTGLSPITIHNFEHLMATLKQLKLNGVKSYIGSCCEGFYCKHQDDLEHIGLPGILIDIDDQTCYDLGKENEALKGTFENQTELKINLLSKLINKINTEERVHE
jgi:lipoate-protein ligase A